MNYRMIGRVQIQADDDDNRHLCRFESSVDLHYLFNPRLISSGVILPYCDKHLLA